MAQRLTNPLGFMRTWVRSLSGLRIRRCCELWCPSQTWRRSAVAGAVARAGSYRSALTPSLGTSVCRGCGPKKEKKNLLQMSEHFGSRLHCLSLTQAVEGHVGDARGCLIQRDFKTQVFQKNETLPREYADGPLLICSLRFKL